MKQAELDLGEARRANNSLCSEKQQLDETVERLQLETDSTARALKAAILDKEQQLVDHDVLKLQVLHKHLGGLRLCRGWFLRCYALLYT